MEVGENKLLEGFYLILKIHQVGNGFIPSVDRYCRHGSECSGKKLTLR